MNWMDRFALFEPLDMVAVLVIFTFWLMLGWRIEHTTAKAPSVAHLMAEYRRAWMVQMITRQPRIFDAQTIATLRQGTSFLASTCVIAIGGTLALIGNADRVAGVAENLTAAMSPAFVWEIKLLLVVFFLSCAFLRFIWSNRLFGYCSVVMAAVPNEVDHPDARRMAGQAAELNITAARSFNRGLRATYFALASIAWLAGPFALMLAAFVTLVVIWRQEFASDSRRVLLEK